MTGKDEPGGFDLDIDLDDDFQEDAPSSQLELGSPSEAPPSAPSRPTPRGIGPPPSAPPPPSRHRSNVVRYRVPHTQPPRRPTRIPGVPLTEAETAQVTPFDIDPEDLSNIFSSSDPLAYGTELGDSDVPETSLDDGFDPWGDLSDENQDAAKPLESDSGAPANQFQAPFASPQQRSASDTLQTPVVGVRDQLAAEAAVPEFDDLADLGFSARPVTLQQLNYADPSYVEPDPLDVAEDYVSFDDVAFHEQENPSGSETAPAGAMAESDALLGEGPESDDPEPVIGLKQLAAGTSEVETNPMDDDEDGFAEFAIDVDDLAVADPTQTLRP